MKQLTITLYQSVTVFQKPTYIENIVNFEMF